MSRAFRISQVSGVTVPPGSPCSVPHVLLRGWMYLRDRPPDGWPDHIYVVMADYGPAGGGWGPAAVEQLGPAVYSSEMPLVLVMMRQLAATLRGQGTDAHVFRFTNPEVVD